MFRDPASSTFRNILVASVIGVGVFLIPNGAQSATSNSATIQWATNQESDLAGYRVYHGTISGNYGNYQNAGKKTTYQYANLESDKTHYFSVTAYDSSGNESNPSLEVKTFIQAAVPPTLTSPNPNTTLEGATTTFTWTPNETSVIEWWLYVGTGQGASDIVDTGSLGTSLSTTITELPTDGRQLWVQLWYKLANGWESRHYQFTAAAHISNFPLTISKSGEGSGTITSNPIGLSCGSTCTASFSTDSPVTLSANPASDSIFSGWSGGGCSGTSSCTLTLSSSASVSANFASSPPPSSSSSVTEEEIKSQQQLAEAARLAEEQRLAEAAKPQEQQQLAKAAKREQQQLAKAAKQERKQLAKAAKLSAKIQRILAKIEQKLITHADNPKAVDQLNRKKIELLVKRDKIQENLSIN
jgi:hypothetical protein